MSYKIERDFISHNLRCVVLALNIGHRCGYVGVPRNHPLYGISYNDQTPILKAIWERAKDGAIGKRGILPVFCQAFEDDSELPRVDVVFDVHGGITYSDSNKEYPAPNNGLWWFGFDCGHAGDAKDESIMDASQIALERKYNFFHGGTIRTEEYVAAECESLAEQLAALFPGEA